MWTQFFSVTLFTSYPISSLHSNSFLAFLLPTAFLHATAPFTMEHTSREQNDSTDYGRVVLSVGYEENTRKCVYHAKQKLWRCSSSIEKDICVSSKREAFHVLMLLRRRR